MLSEGPAPVGANPVMSIFSEGNVVLLQSLASERGLCVKHGRVSGTGIRDPPSQFVVHIRRYGRIALQNVASPNKWLQICSGETRARGDRMEFSEFNVHEVGDNFVALESAVFPGQHVGICETGELKSAAETPPMDPSSFFIPFLHSCPASDSGGGGLRHQIQSPWESNQGTNRQGLPPGWEAARTPDGREYFINHTTRATSWTRPSLEPAPPTGYSIWDLFEASSVLIVPVLAAMRDYDGAMSMRHLDPLQSMLSYPQWAATTSANNLANCVVVTPSLLRASHEVKLMTVNGIVWVNNAKKVFVMKNPLDRGRNESFIVHHIKESIVAFESVLFPGHFLSVDGPGRIAVLEPIDHRVTGFTVLRVQFIVRVKEFEVEPKKPRSPFSGKLSFMAKLADRAVIQLYHKPSQLFLGLHGSEVTLIDDEEDKSTHWEYHDRGMGRLSLTKRGSNRTLAVGENGGLGTVQGMGSAESSDFRVLECPTGELILETSTHNGDYLSFWSPKYRINIDRFSVYLLDVESSSRLTPRDAIN